LHDVIDHVAAELEVGMGKVAQPLRVALTGAGISPSIDQTLWLMGKQRSLQGITKALEYIEARIAAT
jgi:glutamyl-tRNA synthetase